VSRRVGERMARRAGGCVGTIVRSMASFLMTVMVRMYWD